MTSRLPATASRPAWEMATLMYRFDRIRRTVSTRSDLGSADGRLLWLLSDERPRTLRQIADELVLEQSTVNRQVNAAVTHGLVRRERASGDAAYTVSVTEAGRARLQHALSTTLGLHGAALDAMPATARAELMSSLDTIVTAYEQTLALGDDAPTAR